MQPKFTMKDLPLGERPYEIVEARGTQELTDAQLLSIFLRAGTAGEKVLDLSYRLLNDLKTQEDPLLSLFQLPLSSLTAYKGIGRVKAIQLKAAFELAQRLSSRQAKQHIKFNNAETIAFAYMDVMRFQPVETPYVLYLNSKLELISERKLPEGLLQTSLIDHRRIILEAYEKGASQIVLLHNHPSGDPHPSADDIEFTNQFAAIAKLILVPLIDHIIIGDTTYFSFREEGLLPLKE